MGASPEVTPRGVSGESLRWAEERLRLAIEAAHLGCWEWDIARGVVWWSPSLDAVHRIPAGSFAGTFEAWKRDIHPNDVERVLALVQAGLENRTGHSMEYRIICPDGTVRWLEARSQVVCDDEGRPLRMLGVCSDVTERKQLEEARELFIAVLGHDLRNPLQAIQTATTLMMRNEVLPPGTHKAAAVVSRCAERMDRIIGDLLDFTRGRFGHGIPVVKERMAMDVVCRRVLDELMLANSEADVGFAAHGDLVGHWDPERVAQVASNLIGNAIAHGGGGRARVNLTGSDDAVTLTVENGGEPIPAEVMPLLFQPFYSRSTSRSNVGLGLFIVSEIVKAHGGRIEVASSAATGTTFTVLWPRAPREPSP
jgi:PAS domain S-box-containing protein